MFYTYLRFRSTSALYPKRSTHARVDKKYNVNIGVFTDTYLPDIDGVSISIATLKSSLEKLGHTVFIFAPNNKLKYEVFPEEKIWRFPSIKFYGEKNFHFAVKALFPKDLHDVPLDVVHTQTPFPVGRAGLRLAKAKHLRSVHTYHTRYQEYIHYLVPSFILKAGGRKLGVAIIISIVKRFLNNHDAVIAPSSGIKRELESFGVKKPIHVIPTGVDIDRITALVASADPNAIRRKFNLDPDNEMIVFTSRLAREKNVEFLLRAAKTVIDSRPQVRFLIIGDGDHRKSLEETARQLGLKDQVIFAGYMDREQIFPVYRAAKVFVFASTTETQGLSVLEAMASHLPIVALKATGAEDLLAKNQGGFLIENSDPVVFAEAVMNLLGNQDLYIIKSAEAYARAGDFTMEKTAQALVDVYKNNAESVNIYT